MRDDRGAATTRIAITAAYEAIAATLPLGSRAPTTVKRSPWREMTRNWRFQAGTNLWQRLPDPAKRKPITMQGLQGTFVVIIAAAAFLAGLFAERLRADLARQAWQKRRWRKGERGVPFNTGAAPVTDPAEQLRLVMGASFRRRRLLSRSEAHVLYAAERAVNAANLKWRVMAQVSLGEVLSSSDARAYSAINSKRVDLLIVSRNGDPIAAIEYQGHGHHQGTAAARDAVKREALRKAEVRYIEVTPESGTEDMAREISRIAQAERLKPLTA